jgi:N-terminal domain of anti-restriction factor ArdC
MPGTTKHELSDEERAERRRADREYARQAVEQLRSSEGWQRWLAARRHFHAYSFGNQLLIAMARPTATRVAGFRAWLKLGYAVQRGERAIKVWAPCPPSRKQLERWQQDDGGDPTQRRRTYFRLVPVFDRLSRVRSEGCHRTPSRNALPAALRPVLLHRASATAKGEWPWPARSSRSRRPKGDGAAAIARAPPPGTDAR